MDGIGRDRLVPKVVPRPTPAPGEVLVKVAAASLNYRDNVHELVGGPNLGKAVQVAAVGGRIAQIGVLEGFEVAAPSGR